MKNVLFALCAVAALIAAYLGVIKPIADTLTAPIAAMGAQATHAGEDSAGRVR